ncbi:hypothetical protein JB92DRAFT_2574223, partial [Gautieria morchelliformis]
QLHSHIAKALQAQSQAIRTGVATYNDVASRVSPKQPVLDVKKVLEYIFLAQFDVLHDSRHHIEEKPW